MGRFFLLPVLACLGWFVYLYVRGYTLKQGQTGFIVILIASSVLAVLFGLLLWLTH